MVELQMKMIEQSKRKKLVLFTHGWIINFHFGCLVLCGEIICIKAQEKDAIIENQWRKRC
jgi:hypothetical protein